MTNEIINFENTPIRKVWHNEEWYFSIIDIIALLTESAQPQTYWGMLKKREPQLFTICEKFKMKNSKGKLYPIDFTNTEGTFRIIISVPSKKTEDLKLWLLDYGRRGIENRPYYNLSDGLKKILKCTSN
jgi:DNA-damage-inducible protein D